MSKQLTITEALNFLYNYEDLQGGHDEYWKVYRFIEKQLKALETIKECFVFNGFDELIPKSNWFDNDKKQDLVRSVLKK